MTNFLRITVGLLGLASAFFPTFAAAEPMSPVDPNVPAVTNAAGSVQLYCALKWTATDIWVQVYNAGSVTAEPGMLFAYRTVGTDGVEQAFVLQSPVPPGRQLSVAERIPYSEANPPAIWDCEPKRPTKQ